DPGDARVVEQRVGIVEDQARATRAPDDRGPGLPQEEGERHLGSGPGPSHGIGEAAAIAWRAHLRDRGGPDDCGPETRVQEQVHGQAPNDPPSPGEGKGVAGATVRPQRGGKAGGWRGPWFFSFGRGGPRPAGGGVAPLWGGEAHAGPRPGAERPAPAPSGRGADAAARPAVHQWWVPPAGRDVGAGRGPAGRVPAR